MWRGSADGDDIAAVPATPPAERLPTRHVVVEDCLALRPSWWPSHQASSTAVLPGRAPDVPYTSVRSGHPRTTTVYAHALRAVGSARTERSEGVPKLAVLLAQGSTLPGAAGRCGRWSRTERNAQRRSRPEGPRRPSAELSHLAVAISSNGVVLQGAQHPGGRIAHDLPLLVGQLCCAVFHNPGDPWQVMDHPWCEPLARRQERRRIMGEEGAAGRAPRGGRCHAPEYGPR